MSKKRKKKKAKIDKPTLISLIETNWKDIHHSRSQDWQYWVIIGIIIAGIGALNKEIYKNAILINVLIGIGGVISLWATFISYSHWILHIKRLCYINYLGNLLSTQTNIIDYMNFKNSVQYKMKKVYRTRIPNPFVVGGLIFSMHATISVLFIIATILILFKNALVDFSSRKSILFNLIPLISLTFCISIFLIINKIFKRFLGKKRIIYYQAANKVFNSPEFGKPTVK
jgi:hypothetical protein